MMTMALLSRGAVEFGLKLSQEHLYLFEKYYNELIDWNRRFNLTRITEYNEVQIKHFLDSLSLLCFWQPLHSDKVLDVGTGAGFPGIPLKIVNANFKLTLLEATGKKVQFLQHLINILSLQNIEVVNARAEELAHNVSFRGQYDYVLARAVAELPALAELALPFSKLNGRFIAMKKGNIDEELRSAERAIFILGGRLEAIHKMNLPGLDETRYLVEIKKIKETPPEYPRRPGIPAKKPIK